MSDDNVLQALLKTGEVDYAIVSFGAMQELQALPHLTFQSAASPILITFIAYNLDRPLFADKRVRQALTQAIDRKAIVNSLLYEQGEVLDSSLASVSWAYTSNVPRFPYDVDAAKGLLNQAGWTLGADGILQKDGTRFAFTLATNSSNKERAAIATIAQDAWRKVGIDMQTQLLGDQRVLRQVPADPRFRRHRRRRRGFDDRSGSDQFLVVEEHSGRHQLRPLHQPPGGPAARPGAHRAWL